MVLVFWCSSYDLSMTMQYNGGDTYAMVGFSGGCVGVSCKVAWWGQWFSFGSSCSCVFSLKTEILASMLPGLYIIFSYEIKCLD